MTRTNQEARQVKQELRDIIEAARNLGRDLDHMLPGRKRDSYLLEQKVCLSLLRDPRYAAVREEV